MSSEWPLLREREGDWPLRFFERGEQSRRDDDGEGVVVVVVAEARVFWYLTLGAVAVRDDIVAFAFVDLILRGEDNGNCEDVVK